MSLKDGSFVLGKSVGRGFRGRCLCGGKTGRLAFFFG